MVIKSSIDKLCVLEIPPHRSYNSLTSSQEFRIVNVKDMADCMKGRYK